MKLIFYRGWLEWVGGFRNPIYYKKWSPKDWSMLRTPVTYYSKDCTLCSSLISYCLMNISLAPQLMISWPNNAWFTKVFYLSISEGLDEQRDGFLIWASHHASQLLIHAPQACHCSTANRGNEQIWMQSFGWVKTYQTKQWRDYFCIRLNSVQLALPQLEIYSSRVGPIFIS